MVAHGLAFALWFGSVALYGAAFFFPEVHRRHDFFWSGVAAFYGLVLWFDAAQISSTELLGHGASLALLCGLGWQTLTLRRKRTPLDLQTPLTDKSWPTFWANLQRAGLSFTKATPLGRWLPSDWESPKAADPAIAVATIRVSSLKDVDYEFVDELARPLGPEAEARAIAPEESTPTSIQPKPRSKQPVGRSQPAPTTPKPATPTPQLRRPPIGKIAGLRNWLGNLAKARPSPKPNREVIEIPPRPSPLDRKRAQQEGSKQGGARGSKREMIDIPPRPSPLDRKRPAASAQPPQGVDTAPAVTIVDAAVVESADRPDSIDSPSTSTQTTPPIPDPKHPSNAPEPPQKDAPEDSDSNWVDD